MSEPGSLSASRDIWLSLAPGVDIAVPRHEALTMDEAGFTALFLKHTSGSKAEAETWAERQVEERDAYLEGREPRVERG